MTPQEQLRQKRRMKILQRAANQDKGPIPDSNIEEPNPFERYKSLEKINTMRNNIILFSKIIGFVICMLSYLTIYSQQILLLSIVMQILITFLNEFRKINNSQQNSTNKILKTVQSISKLIQLKVYPIGILNIIAGYILGSCLLSTLIYSLTKESQINMDL